MSETKFAELTQFSQFGHGMPFPTIDDHDS